MYKKILALCLSVVIAMSASIMPVLADDSHLIIRGDNDKNIFTALAKPDKKNNDNVIDILKQFTDSEDVDWAEKSIEKLGAMGILSGMEKGLFKPNGDVTHVEAIAMILKLLGQKEQAEAIKTQPEYFKGQSDSWSYGYLQLALDKGIIIPSEDGKFNPKTPAKRHEIAKYIVRAIGKRDEALKNAFTKLSFKDTNAIPKNSIGYVYVITNLGIMQGSKNEFQPNKPVTRAEMAVLLDRAVDKFDDEITNDNAYEGIFVAFDKTNSLMTLNINRTQVVYKVNPYAPVYKNNTYYTMDTLKAGDIIEIVLDNNNNIIFIEFKNNGTIPPTGQLLSIQHMQYENLPLSIKEKIDVLKLTENYAAFKQDQFIYLIASRGQMPSGGYSIVIKDSYKETIQPGKYNLKATVEKQNPTTSVVTTIITYPYDIVKLSYFDGIEKINFVDSANTLLRQTALNMLDNVEVISGKINTVDTTNRIVYLKGTDNVLRAYFIPANVEITLNNTAVALAALTANMNLAITKTNGVITKLAAQSTADTVEVINGKINTVDVTSRIVYLNGTDNVLRAYFIPANVEITLNNTAVTLAALTANMNLAITKTNGVITKLAAQSTADTVEVINGKINTVDVTSRIVYLNGTDNVLRAYFIPANVEITLNNTAVTLAALTANMNLAITKINGVITKLAAQSTADTVEVINGKINSIDATNRIVYLKEADNIVRPYFIPTNIPITLNNTAVALTALSANMTAALTRTSGIITKLEATQTIQVITGKIDSIDTANNTVKLLENNNVVNSYVIPANTPITLNNQSANLANLTRGMNASIIKIDGVITKLEAQNDIQLLEGVLINVYPSQNNSSISVKIGNDFKLYLITPETAVFYNNQSISIQNMPLNITITMKLINGIVVEVKNK